MWSARLQRLSNQTIYVIMLATWYESALCLSPFLYLRSFLYAQSTHLCSKLFGRVIASSTLLRFGVNCISYYYRYI
ncbi:hypothetical protein BC941DRAFT_442454 [Chlamydoabsidia padenii]|nr:hypothetical protein BC941DRAFT_442454 [Chlamydoabsidia padenii]